MTEQRILRRWGTQGVQWRDWLRWSPLALELFTWWRDGVEYAWLLGEDAYTERLVDLLSRASPRDCAAAGFGCTRRIDRSCREPETCMRDPAEPAVDDYRFGPMPGACDSFHGYLDTTPLHVKFTAENRHRAVFRYDQRDSATLWVDGVRVEADATLDSMGYWLAHRFLVVWAEGPGDHPAQTYGLGHPMTSILSVFLYDAEHAAGHLLVPEDTQRWTHPVVKLVGGELQVYRDQEAGEPDRVLPI